MKKRGKHIQIEDWQKEKIKELSRKGVYQIDISRTVGLSPSTVNRIVNGKDLQPGIFHVDRYFLQNPFL
jgi:hypothetical protein